MKLKSVKGRNRTAVACGDAAERSFVVDLLHGFGFQWHKHSDNPQTSGEGAEAAFPFARWNYVTINWDTQELAGSGGNYGFREVTVQELIPLLLADYYKLMLKSENYQLTLGSEVFEATVGADSAQIGCQKVSRDRLEKFIAAFPAQFKGVDNGKLKCFAVTPETLPAVRALLTAYGRRKTGMDTEGNWVHLGETLFSLNRDQFFGYTPLSSLQELVDYLAKPVKKQEAQPQVGFIVTSDGYRIEEIDTDVATVHRYKVTKAQAEDLLARMNRVKEQEAAGK